VGDRNGQNPLLFYALDDPERKSLHQTLAMNRIDFRKSFRIRGNSLERIVDRVGKPFGG
jgi:hypothetical protein